MEDLADKRCLACEGGQPPLTEEQISELLPGLSQDWKVIENHHLRREWGFSDFASALEFVNLAGGICEDEGHHADFEVGWGRVKAEIWTHKIDGLTESDFYLAAKFDRIER
ncbi:MAG: 4a-hydroxytetrahydrobiopterin dehydratase [Candidatus Thermoplasmatota archaeon]|nr:4a-hydroxytetrahydrobiopterin dehydratase [Candidatus Thermoplasmatota archaeon]